MTGSRRVLLGVLVAWLLLLTSLPATAEEPPDQVDEPAPGEGQPLEDPSDPPPAQYSTASQPSPRVSLTGATWRRPDLTRDGAAHRYSAAIRASRRGWSSGSRSVVLTAGEAFYNGLAAAPLAGVLNAPLLLTKRDQLPAAVADEIRRLNPGRVFLVGRATDGVATRVRRLGVTVIRLRGDTHYTTSMVVAREVVRRSTNRTGVVASGSTWSSSLGVPAYAAKKGAAVLLTPPNSGTAVLTRRVRELGARKTLVIGSPSVISRKVVANLPNVTRVAGTKATATVTQLARIGRRSGMDGRPVIVSGSHWGDALAWGVKAGDRNNAVVLSTTGGGVAASVAGYLNDYNPGRIAIAESDAALSATTKCQIARGRFRSWYCAEMTLGRQGYVVPRADNSTDRFSVFAIYAFEKVAGLRPDGAFGNREWDLMLRNPRMPVRRPDLPAKHVEINIGKQLVLLIENGRVRNQIHTSTGAPSTPTIRGTFTIYEKRPYRQSHNQMYYPVFFPGGYAIHGYPSIPLYPASHGCARVYDGNMDFIYPRVFIGERVATY